MQKIARIFFAGLPLFAALFAPGMSLARNSSAMAYVGWVWADQPETAGCYTPNPAYAYSTIGSSTPITVCRESTGVYDVYFYGFAGTQGVQSNVQVSAYQTRGYCEAGSSGANASYAYARVYCFGPTGQNFTAQDNIFSLFWQGRTGSFGTGSFGEAFVFANIPGATGYTPSYQYNSLGRSNTIIRNSAGNYTVTIPGLQYIQSDVQVTAFTPAAGNPGRCNVVNWNSYSGGGTNVNVQCYDASGRAADWAFNLAYALSLPFDYAQGYPTAGAWAWANDPESTAIYTPSILYQYDDFQSGNLTAQKLGTGYYAVYLPGNLSIGTSNAIVSAYGSSGTYCNVYGWSSTTIYIDCWNQNGNPADSYFDVAFDAWFSGGHRVPVRHIGSARHASLAPWHLD